VERLSIGVAALSSVQLGEVAECRPKMGVVGADCLRSDGKGSIDIHSVPVSRSELLGDVLCVQHGSRQM
jgi:hypothetical protein